MKIRSLFAVPSGIALLAGLLTFGPGCSQQSDSGSGAPVADGADSVAFAQALEIEEEAGRIDALAKLIDDYPGSRWAGNAYPRLISMMREQNPEQVAALLKEFEATDFESPNVYNAVGWDLAVAEEHLDIAIPILEKAVAKARTMDEPQGLASCLDSEAWARYKKGDHATAVTRMEEAYEVYGPGNDEIDEHMALIYDAAGRDEEAKKIYVDLLGHMENPEIRGHLEAIVGATGGSLDAVNSEINALRAANATPVPALALPSLADGETISIADYRGKAVLLAFFHPT